MTTPDERIDALVMAENVLTDMLHDEHMLLYWKDQIRSVLRHYPWPLYIRMLRNDPPDGWK
jgi:hypothetical protein